MNEKNRAILIPVILAITLGLAPYVPEPHIYKQILNIKNGTFTEPLDWFDLLLHGFPWVWLIIATSQYFKKKISENKG